MPETPPTLNLFGGRVEPLASRLRPKSIDEVIGQDHLLGPSGKLRKLIQSDILTSIILFGPAGTGKSSLAEVIAHTTKSEFIRLNATQATTKDIRKYGEKAKGQGTPIVVFLDEIHRFSKTQQDAFLPYVESGHIILIGATTENPYFSVNSSLLSRAQMVCELEPLKPAHLLAVLKRGLEYYKANGKHVTIDREAAMYLITIANGDGRKVLSTLEVAVAVADNASETKITIELIKAVSPSKHMVFGDQSHFNIASAFQGSIQASDPDAAIYWLSMWLESGEDPRYIARRLMVSASEDAAGNPECAMVAHSAYVAACEVGRPECDIILAHATVLTASAPRNKSAACAIWEAVKDVREGVSVEVPKEMRDSHYPAAGKLGHGDYHDGANQAKYVGISRRYYKPEVWDRKDTI